MYVSPNFKTKKELKTAVAEGRAVTVFQPGLGPDAPENGKATIEGPHYPQPHRWYAQVTIKDGIVDTVK